jgi:lipopolysaccharide/colanic/teichoic acid biosynthesis glycosyltransferase
VAYIQEHGLDQSAGKPGVAPDIEMRGREAQLAIKRGFDVLGAVLGLAMLSPLLGITALAVLLFQGRPVLFRQTRPGFRGRPFQIVKFRTMRTPRVDEVWYLSDEQRVTRLGRILRKTSLDELPELWNVLRGEMSLVGPRPLLMEYLDKYTVDERRRHDMLPGITGWAAVNGRHSLKFSERLALDTWYVDHWSIWLDLKILARTLYQVLALKDVVETQNPAVTGAPLEAVPPRTTGPSPLDGGTVAARDHLHGEPAATAPTQACVEGRGRES